jgi:hypothetical protein
VDKIYDLFPDVHKAWMNRRKLRRIFNEEAAFKAQFYNIWALAIFGQVMAKVQENGKQLDQASANRLYSTDYMDPQKFLFDSSNCMAVSFEQRHSDGLFRNESFKFEEDEHGKLLPVPPLKARHSQSKSTSTKLSNKANLVSKSLSFKPMTQERVFGIKDTCELISDAFNGLDTEIHNQRLANLKVPNTNGKGNNQRFSNVNNNLTSNSSTSSLNLPEIAELIRKCFTKFKHAAVIIFF